ncbi:MAG TPA: hypothetical protein VGC99_17060 [Candidatus Tectomicrobia bacterium]
MSQTLILELSEAVYTTIQRQAESAGTSPAHWLATTLEQQYGPRHAGQSARRPRTAAEQHAARVRFEQHFGEVDLPDAIGADNEQIDADLAREYSDTHEAP